MAGSRQARGLTSKLGKCLPAGQLPAALAPEGSAGGPFKETVISAPQWLSVPVRNSETCRALQIVHLERARTCAPRRRRGPGSGPPAAASLWPRACCVRRGDQHGPGLHSPLLGSPPLGFPPPRLASLLVQGEQGQIAVPTVCGDIV